MRLITLARTSYTKYGTYGIMLDETMTPICVTLERPWTNNKKNDSCIPVDTYKVERMDTEKSHFMLEPKYNRDGIMIHRGNTIKDSTGCILLGTYFIGTGIGESRKAYDKFVGYFHEDEEFNLLITGSPDE